MTAALTDAQYEWLSAALGIELRTGGGTAAPGDGRMPDDRDLSGGPGARSGGPPTASPGRAQDDARSDKDLHEMGRWPHLAHAAWRRLTGPQRAAVTVTMAKLYGEAFAKAFLAFTESGARLEQQHYGPGFPEHTTEWFEKRGYALAMRDSLNDWWAHPSGHVITADRGIPWSKTPPGSGPAGTGPTGPGQKPPPPRCQEGDAQELLRITLDSIREDLAEDADRQDEIVRQKEAMDRMNVTSEEFREAYDAYVALLKDAQGRVKDQIDAVADAQTSLKEMCANDGAVEAGRSDLEEVQIWFDVQRGLLDMEGRKPIKADVK